MPEQSPAAEPAEIVATRRFAFHLHHHRSKQGLSQEALGKMAGIRQAEVSKLEKALKLENPPVPSLGTVARCAAALGEDITTLLQIHEE